MKKIIFLFVQLLIWTISYGQTQNEMNEDANNHYLKTEKQINKVYQEIIKKYSSDTLFITKLKVAQRLWIKFRDAELDMKFPNRSYSGSLFTMCYMDYKTDLTEARINKLKQWLKSNTDEEACSGSIR